MTAPIEATLAISYAPRPARGGVAALLALDKALGGVLRSARDPMLAQIRMTWWHGALEALDSAPAPAMPELAQLAEHVVPHGVTGVALARLVEGWEALIDDAEIGDDALAIHADARGGALFAAIARLCGYEGPAVAQAGRGWALADLAGNLGDPVLAARVRVLATPYLDRALLTRWGRRGRTLGALAHLARLDLSAPDAPVAGSPRRVARMAWHALTGR